MDEPMVPTQPTVILKPTKWNHNILAVLFPVLVALFTILLVHFIPAIGFAPIEEVARNAVRIAVLMAAWPIALRFLGGLGHSVTETAKQQPWGLTPIACAIILSIALVMK